MTRHIVFHNMKWIFVGYFGSDVRQNYVLKTFKYCCRLRVLARNRDDQDHLLLSPTKQLPTEDVSWYFRWIKRFSRFPSSNLLPSSSLAVTVFSSAAPIWNHFLLDVRRSRVLCEIRISTFWMCFCSSRTDFLLSSHNCCNFPIISSRSSAFTPTSFIRATYFFIFC